MFKKKKKEPEVYQGVFDEHTRSLLKILINWAGYRKSPWKFTGELSLNKEKYTYSLEWCPNKLIFEMQSPNEHLRLIGNEHDEEFFKPYFEKAREEVENAKKKKDAHKRNETMERIRYLTAGIVESNAKLYDDEM